MHTRFTLTDGATETTMTTLQVLIDAEITAEAAYRATCDHAREVAYTQDHYRDIVRSSLLAYQSARNAVALARDSQ